ncbi:MAG: hypothetical protein IT385_06385 [Deltaproteobacteria bacterium]|nr:hypothetical protein [Deltaproteobacteria bacterium]
MNWHVTWQDPVAIALVVLVVLGARWLKRRLTPVGCAACPHTGADASPDTRGPTPPTRVPVERMRLGRSGPSGASR